MSHDRWFLLVKPFDAIQADIIAQIADGTGAAQDRTRQLDLIAIQNDQKHPSCCILGITSHHEIDFKAISSSLSGSYFLGPCHVADAIVCHSDIRGDELKQKGDVYKGLASLISHERVTIQSSLLYKTLVHNCSHNPDALNAFSINQTIACQYANIHGSSVEQSLLGAFSTVDLMEMKGCWVGAFSYIQVPACLNLQFDPGTIMIQTDEFCLQFSHKPDVVDQYIGLADSLAPEGVIDKFMAQHFQAPADGLQTDRKMICDTVVPDSSSVHPYAVIQGETTIAENVLVSQNAFVDTAVMGKGSNAQENSMIMNSRLEGMNVTAHGGKIIHADMGKNTFTGFNSFLFGKENARMTIGSHCIVMPHTIIDIQTPLNIPDNTLIWGYITGETDLALYTIPIDQFKKINSECIIGDLQFNGKGDVFIQAFSHRIEHILEANGAYFNEGGPKGHAQYNKDIAISLFDPYPSNEHQGLFPTIKVNG